MKRAALPPMRVVQPVPSDRMAALGCGFAALEGRVKAQTAPAEVEA